MAQLRQFTIDPNFLSLFHFYFAIYYNIVMAGIRFSFAPENKILTIQLASSDSEIIHYGTLIKRLDAETLPYDLSRLSLVETLKSMQQDLSNKFRIYYPNGKTETFDEAVQSMINGLGNSVSPNFLSDISAKKAYAKYYYEMFKNKLIPIDEKHSDALILTSLVSYYFMKRLVHVFVMCTIYQKVAVPITGNVPSTSPIIINNDQGYDFTTERNLLQAKILALEAALRNSETSSDASVDKLTQINAQHTDILNKAEAKIRELQQQVANYRELLLKSTTMIFKLDEIPNVVLGSR